MPASVSTRPPRFVAPPGACDSHCHVFGPEDRFPFEPGLSYYPPIASRETVFALHRALGLSRGVIVQGAEYAFDNSIVLDALAAARGNYRGIAVMDPNATDAEIRRLNDGGICGMRLSLVHGANRDPAALERIAGRIAPLGWHVELHLEPDDLAAYAPVLKALPVPVVIDHMARIAPDPGVAHPAFRALLQLLRNDKIWVKVSGIERVAPPPYEAVVPMARELLAAARDRIVWGTNFPHPKLNGTADDAGLLDVIPLFAPDAADQRRLLVDNPARLYGF